MTDDVIPLGPPEHDPGHEDARPEHERAAQGVDEAPDPVAHAAAVAPGAPAGGAEPYVPGLVDDDEETGALPDA